MDTKAKVKFNIIAIICIVLLAFVLTPITFQNDTYYTIKIGEHIVQNGVDMKDPFSWHEGLTYTYPHWLYDLGTYCVYYIGGFEGIYVVTVLLACILGIVLYGTTVKISKNHFISFLLTMGAMFLLKDFIAARAQLVTFILFVLTVYFIEMFIQTKKKRYVFGLIVIPIIIANVHAAVWAFYFVLYLPYIAEYILAVIRESDWMYKVKVFRTKNKIKKLQKKNKDLDKILELEKRIENLKEKQDRAEQKRRVIDEKAYKIKIKKKDPVKWLILIMLVCLLTGLLTPQLTEPYTHIVKLMSGTSTENIAEHLPLVLIQNTYAICVILIFLAILMFTDTKIELADAFMLAGLLFLMFMGRRQFSLLVLIGVNILVKLITAFIDKYSPKITEKVEKLIVKFPYGIIVVLITILLCIFLYREKIDDEFVNKSAYPVEAAEFIKRNLDLNHIRLYNEYNYGSYLLFQDIPVFIDSRADLYTPEFNPGKDIFTDFINISNMNIDYETKFKEYGITHVLIYRNSKLNTLIAKDSNYEQVYMDQYFVVYERTRT